MRAAPNEDRLDAMQRDIGRQQVAKIRRDERAPPQPAGSANVAPVSHMDDDDDEDDDGHASIRASACPRGNIPRASWKTSFEKIGRSPL